MIRERRRSAENYGMTGLLLVAVGVMVGAEPSTDETSRRIALQLAQLAGDNRQLPAVRVEALRTLAKLDSFARPAVPALIELIDRNTESPEVIEQAVAALGRIGPPARSALPAMARIYGRDIDIDIAVRRATERITAPPDSADLQELIRDLRAREPGRRLRGAKGIAAKGLRAEEAIPDLLPLLRDPDTDVRRMAVLALRAVEPGPRYNSSIADAYALDLSDADENVRLIAARSLARMGPAAAPAAAALQRAQVDPSEEVRRAATEALGKLGPPPSPPGPVG